MREAVDTYTGELPVTARILAQFSCGAASAVATKMALARYGASHDVQILNAFVAEEHEDNRRFLADSQAWFGRKIEVLCNKVYNGSITEVFRRERYMKGPHGAPCSKLLKRRLLSGLERKGDVIVLGFTAEETGRFEDFQERNPGRAAIAPLIDAGLGKDDVKAMVQRAGLRLPVMYEMGYDNANCTGCIKGGEGYWRAVREDFPVAFEERCKVQDELGEGSWFLRYRSGPLTGQRFPLRELPAGPARRNEKLPSCSFFCEMAEAEYAA